MLHPQKGMEMNSRRVLATKAVRITAIKIAW
jgi:hypothetical protein